MVDKKRDIFIKVENVTEIVGLLTGIKDKEIELKKLFAYYDELNMAENKLFENWNNYLDDINQKLDHTTL